MRNRRHAVLAGAAMALLSAPAAGCAQEGPASGARNPGPAFESPESALSFEDIYMDAVPPGYEEIEIAGGPAPLSGLPAPDTSLSPTPSGKLTKSNSMATIDYSNTSDGYVMVNSPTPAPG